MTKDSRIIELLDPDNHTPAEIATARAAMEWAMKRQCAWCDAGLGMSDVLHHVHDPDRTAGNQPCYSWELREVLAAHDAAIAESSLLRCAEAVCLESEHGVMSGFLVNKLNTLRAAIAEYKAGCRWTEERDGEYWDTGCGHAFCFETGGPKENEMKSCPYCGLPVKDKDGKDVLE